MSIVIRGSLITVIDEKTGDNLFKGSESELTQFIKDAKEIADYIQTDIDADILVEDDQNFSFETYQNFANKYK
jgi:hypothetical protein